MIQNKLKSIKKINEKANEALKLGSKKMIF